MTTEELEKLLSEATPGPWRVDPHADAEIVTGRGVKVSSVWSKEDMGKCITIDRKCVPDRHYKPNARLIALAPALARKVIAAEKLVEALGWAEDELASYAPDPACRSKITDDVLRKVRAALAAWEAAQ